MGMQLLLVHLLDQVLQVKEPALQVLLVQVQLEMIMQQVLLQHTQQMLMQQVLLKRLPQTKKMQLLSPAQLQPMQQVLLQCLMLGGLLMLQLLLLGPWLLPLLHAPLSSPLSQTLNLIHFLQEGLLEVAQKEEAWQGW